MNREGFTLVEVMVALAIFALISAAGVLVLSQVVEARFGLQANTARVAELQRTLAVLKSDLAQAAPRATRGPSGRPSSVPVVAGQGAGDPVLTLVRAGWSNPDGEARPSLQKVEYRIADGRLERRTYRYLDGAAAGPVQVLYRGVSDVSVTMIQRGGEAPAYMASRELPLPDAVRVRMTLKGYGPVEQVFLVAGA